MQSYSKNYRNHINYGMQPTQNLPDRRAYWDTNTAEFRRKKRIERVIFNNIPSDVGFATDFNWTAGLIAKYIQREYGYDYSNRGITGILDCMGLSYTRPTYVLANADKEK